MTLIRDNPDFFSKFQLVIVSLEAISQENLELLSDICNEKKIPIVFCRSIGMIGFLRISFSEHAVIETHPDGPIDLRLDCPWPELEEFVEKNSYFDKMDKLQLGHVPYVVLILKAKNLWLQKV